MELLFIIVFMDDFSDDNILEVMQERSNYDLSFLRFPQKQKKNDLYRTFFPNLLISYTLPKF